MRCIDDSSPAAFDFDFVLRGDPTSHFLNAQEPGLAA
jgi:hypothetical protein